MNRVSPELAALYRLFLRAISASVLHHPAATRNLRKLYRPCFVDAASVENEKRDTRDAGRRDSMERWLTKWNERSDNTLEMLLSSATSRGLSHRLTRNMGFLVDSYIKFRRPKPGRIWDPRLPAESPLYTPSKAVLPTKQEARLHREKVDVNVFRALGQVINLAEGRSGVILGRLPHSR